MVYATGMLIAVVCPSVSTRVRLIGTVVAGPPTETAAPVVIYKVMTLSLIAAWTLSTLVDIDATVLPSISSDARTDVSWCVGGLRALAFVVAWL
jgi:hypothetical protein